MIKYIQHKFWVSVGKEMFSAEKYFEEYFDKKKSKKPYRSLNENLEDYSAFLEMLLEKSLEFRMEMPEYFHMPGTIMTDEQAEKYYKSNPAKRSRNAFVPDFAKEVQKALSYIRGRECLTKECLPFAFIRKEFSLSLFEELAVLLPLGMAMDINTRNLYAYIANDATLKVPTTGVLLSVYQMIDEDCDQSLIEGLVDRMGRMSVFFFKSFDGGIRNASLMDIQLILRDDVLSYILSNRQFDHPVPYAKVYPGERVALDLFRCNFPADIADEGLVYISSKDAEDVPQFLLQYRESGVLILDGDSLIFDVRKIRSLSVPSVIAYALGALFFRIRITGETLCVRVGDSADRLYEMLFDCIRCFLPGRLIFVFGEDRFPEAFLSGEGDISSIGLETPDVEERAAIWEYFFSKEGLQLSGDISIPDLADCYELSFSKIRRVVKETSKNVKWAGKDKIESFELKEQLRHLGESGLLSLAVYIPPVYSMDDLQIEDAQKNVLLTACNRFKIRNRVEKKYGIKRSGAYGNGVSVLLCGPPGTGKTMAAQVISKELSLPLYRVDVSQIFSKYIGETQKNLGEVFDQARKTNVILFFDEADALFSKRTDVGDSHDKYANAETAFLLQKVEAHSGMTVLATNLFGNFDAAFARRLSYVIRLQKPDAATRLALWKSILPKEVKLAADVDFGFFAEKFDLSGSGIKSVLYSAMYMAAAENRPLGNGDIVRSIRYEYEKTGQMIDSAEFGRYSGYLF